MKVRHKITLAGVLAAIIPVLIAISVIVLDVVASDNQKAGQIVQGHVATIASSLSSFFDDARTTATALAALQEDLQLDWADAEKVFNHLFSANSTIDRVALVDSDAHIYEAGRIGNVWQGGKLTENDSLPDARPISVAGTDYFNALVANNSAGSSSVRVSEPSLSSSTGRKSIITSAPIINEGRPAGLVAVRQSAAYLARIYNKLFNDFSFTELFGLNFRLYLISDGGQLLSSVSYNDERGLYDDSLQNSTEIVPSSKIGSEALEAFNAALRGSVTIQDIEGEPQFVAAMRVEGTPFAVCLIVPQRYMAATAARILRRGVIFFIIIAIAACLAVPLLSDVSRQVQDRSTSIAGSAVTISGAVEKIIANSNTNSSAIDTLVDITSSFKL